MAAEEVVKETPQVEKPEETVDKVEKETEVTPETTAPAAEAAETTKAEPEPGLNEKKIDAEPIEATETKPETIEKIATKAKSSTDDVSSADPTSTASDDEKAQPTTVETKTDVEAQAATDEAAINRKAESRLLRKLDLHVIPPLFILFLLAFLDRVNIGNARTQGMSEDLDLSGNHYNIALAVFFVPYIVFEMPSNILIRRLAPSTWLCGIMAAWGLFTLVQGFVKTYNALVGLRFMIGLCEAGFAPGAVYLISMYYKRYELQWRMSLFFCASILGGALSNILAYGIAKMDGDQGYKGWRWIFILEGIITIAIAGISWFFVVDWPETAKFLNDDERALLLRRLESDSSFANMDTLDKRAIKRILTDWKVWVAGIMYMGTVNVGYSISYFTPLILLEMAFTGTGAASNARTIPIFVVAAAVALIAAWVTDRYKHRTAWILFGVVLSSVGYIVLLRDDLPVKVKYMALYFVATGGYLAQPVIWGWLVNNVGGHYKRGSAVAIQIAIGNVGGIIASNIFITSEGPKYVRGYATSLALILLTGVFASGAYWGLRRENKLRDAGGRDYRYEESQEQLNNMGDDHPDFRFTN